MKQKRIKWIAGIYARVSTDHENQKTSNESQISIMQEWANSKKDVEIYDTYIDEGKSGTKIDKRYSFQRMLTDAKNGVINLIIVKSVTRFARNQVDSIKLAQELKDMGVRIYFHQEQIDTFEDAKMLGLWSWLSENESRVTSERRSAGGKAIQKKGKFTQNRPPLGYERNKNTGKLEINSEEQPIVEKIFDYYLEGLGFAKIASELNNQGYKTRRGYAFRADKIKYILDNEVYVGSIVANKFGKKDMMSKGVSRKPKEEWIVVEDAHEPIISKEKFEKVQQLMEDKSFKLSKQTTYPLSGVMKCGKCGHALYVSHNTKNTKRVGEPVMKTYRYYACSYRKQAGSEACDNPPIPLEILYEIVNKELCLLKSNPKIIEKIKEDTLRKINKKLENNDVDLDKINKRIQEIDEERMMLLRQNLKGMIKPDLYVRMEAELDDELKALNLQKNKTVIVDNRKVFEKRYKEFMDTIFKFKDISQMSNLEVRRLVDRIVVDGNDISIELKINANDFEIEESLEVNPIISMIGMNSKHIGVTEKHRYIKDSTHYARIAIKYAG